MSSLTIRVYDDPCLKAVSNPIEEIDEDLRRLIAEMFETMYEGRGIGLAAPQVGVNRRLFVMDLDWVDDEEGKETGEKNPQVFVNPEILWESTEDEVGEEGCLSLPNIRGDVYRTLAVKIRYLDEKGERRERTVEDLEARCVQHELDHLDGKLFIDRMPFIRRRLLAGKLAALKKRQSQT